MKSFAIREMAASTIIISLRPARSKHDKTGSATLVHSSLRLSKLAKRGPESLMKINISGVLRRNKPTDSTHPSAAFTSGSGASAIKRSAVYRGSS